MPLTSCQASRLTLASAVARAASPPRGRIFSAGASCDPRPILLLVDVHNTPCPFPEPTDYYLDCTPSGVA